MKQRGEKLAVDGSSKMVVSNVLYLFRLSFALFSRHCVILIYAKIHSVFPSGVPFLHMIFLENEVQASEKNYGAVFFN